MLGVQALYVYKPDGPELTVRAWAVFLNEGVSDEALDLTVSSATLKDQTGATLATLLGVEDAIGPSHAIFRLAPGALVSGQHYTLIVSLRTAGGVSVGPRSFGIPVN